MVSELARGRLCSAAWGLAVLDVPALPAPLSNVLLVLLGDALASLLAALTDCLWAGWCKLWRGPESWDTVLAQTSELPLLRTLMSRIFTQQSNAKQCRIRNWSLVRPRSFEAGLPRQNWERYQCDGNFWILKYDRLNISVCLKELSPPSGVFALPTGNICLQSR